MNKYIVLSEFEEMLNKKKAAIEEERKPIQEARRPRPRQRRTYALVMLRAVSSVHLSRGSFSSRGEQNRRDAVSSGSGREGHRNLKAGMATDTTEEQIAAIKAQVDELRAANMQLEDEVEQIKTIVETVKNRAHPNRGTGKPSQAGAEKQLPRAENRRPRS